MFDFSAVQILLVLGIALLVLGPKRLPGMAKSLGHELRGLRDSLAGKDEPDDRADGPTLALVTEADSDDRASTGPEPVEPARSVG